MTRKNTSKINLLVKQASNCALLTSKWLNEHAITAKLAWWYAKTGWLEKVGNKLYKRSGKNFGWHDIVSALQQQLVLPLHIGGKTALQLLGKSHYVLMQDFSRINLYAGQKVSLPSWLNNVAGCSTTFKVHQTELFDKNFNKGIVKREFNGFELQFSAPERAILELLAGVPKESTYEEAFLLMGNLPQSRPKIAQSLLENCNSIVAKRLFLHLAEKCQHEWLKELDIKNITLGSGKRKIGAGGIFDAKYKISVPRITTE